MYSTFFFQKNAFYKEQYKLFVWWVDGKTSEVSVQKYI